MRISQLVETLSSFKPNVLSLPVEDLAVESLTDDSREVRPNSVFVAVKGTSFDGHSALPEVIAKGCAVVVVQGDMAVAGECGSCCCIEVDDTRSALAVLAAAWFGYPADSMTMIGVTGTNGKTTCTWMVEAMLAAAGYVPGVIGTVSYRYLKGNKVTVLQDAPLTTPGPIVLNRTLQRMRDAGVTHVVMEVSSHALDQKRIGPLLFDAAVFTNLSRDHLDYHRDLEDYFAAKEQLFANHLKASGCGIVAVDTGDATGNWTDRLIAAIGDRSKLVYGLAAQADVKAEDVIQDENGTSCRLITPIGENRIDFGLTGNFNVLNMLATAGVGVWLHMDMETICSGLSAIRSVPGRMERVRGSDEDKDMPVIFVDYAHTPDALEKALAALKPLCTGRLVCVFGCGGDRDRGKRPEMGMAAGKQSDIVIITSDNPRSEEPGQIISDIIPGVERAGMRRQSQDHCRWSEAEGNMFLVEADRARAIRLALTLSSKGDFVLIAGKGHENYQIIDGAKRFFDDRIEALNAMAGWRVETIQVATRGHVLSGSQTVALREVSTDSRKVESGDIFVALRGDQFDGHAYLEAAVDNGAAAVVVDQDCGPFGNIPVIKVDDTLRALGDMASYRRSRFGRDLTVVGITGSSGKTTVKEMTASIFSLNWPEKYPGQDMVLKTKGNFNNLVGLPLSLLPVGAGHKAAILEMGMNAFGEIERLASIADPDIGCITNVHPAHLLGLGSVEGVAKAKGELFKTMRPDAVRVVNMDDPMVRRVSASAYGERIGYAVTPAGRKFKPVVRAKRIKSLGAQGTRFTLEINGRSERITLSVPGVHNVSDAAAAASICHAAGVSLETIARGLERYRAYDKRLVVTRIPGGVNMVNDTYNANPGSMAAALQTVGSFGRGCKHVAALGDMLELGDASEELHQRIGEQVALHRYSSLAVTGQFAGKVAEGAVAGGMSPGEVHIFSTPVDIASWLYHQIVNGVIGNDDWILAKGSRGMRMETMIEELERLLKP